MLEEARKNGEVLADLGPQKPKKLHKEKPVEFESVEDKGWKLQQSQCHKGWITKIRYFDELFGLMSSSLDGFIHIHSIDDLSYLEKTFNLHQKGVNAFVYSH